VLFLYKRPLKMKKLLHLNYLVITFVFVFNTAVKAQESVSKSSNQINFIENSWNEALKQAARQNKYIFVDAYASWCGPCKMLKATTFKNNKVADFYNDNFVNVAIDMEKGQGPALAAQWGLQAYPTMIIFTSKGKPVSGTVGYIRANDLIKFGRQALNK
jgi:thiol:disulfide interchange protein